MILHGKMCFSSFYPAYFTVSTMVRLNPVTGLDWSKEGYLTQSRSHTWKVHLVLLYVKVNDIYCLSVWIDIKAMAPKQHHLKRNIPSEVQMGFQILWNWKTVRDRDREMYPLSVSQCMCSVLLTCTVVSLFFLSVILWPHNARIFSLNVKACIARNKWGQEYTFTVQ